MKKGNFLIQKVFLVMLLLVGLVSNVGVLQVQAAAHTQTECVNWAKSQLNKGLDYDGVYGNQCVDLIKYYYQYLGYANYATGNACAYATNNLPPGWTRVYSNFQPGDIAVWKVNHSCSTCGTSSLGHVGIITSADSVGFNAVNQNYNGHSYCTENWFYCSALQCAIRPDFSSSGNSNSGSNTGISWTSSVSDITYTNAKVSATISTPTSVQYQWAGCNIFDSNGTMIAQAGENTSVRGTYMNIWYDITAETWNHIQLSPGTTYQYQFYATYGEKDYFSPVYKFTTKQQTINVTGVSLNQTAKALTVGEQFQLNAAISPSNATNKNVTWSVDNTSVAVINNGLVTAKGAGVTTVTVKTADGAKMASCQITVSKPSSDSGNATETQEDAYDYTPAKTTLNKLSPISTGTQLTWNKVNNATGYYIYRSVNGGSYSKYRTITSNSIVSYKDTSVTNGNMYSYRIMTYKSVNGSIYKSSYSNAKKICYLDKNTVKGATNMWGRRAKITWSRNLRGSGYELQYSTSSGFTNSKVVTVKGNTNLNKTLSWLSKGKTYHVRVRSYRYVDGVKYYSCWSSSKQVKITK